MRKYDQIIFLFEIPVVESYYSRYGMELFVNEGYEIIVIDLSVLMYPQSLAVNKDFLLKSSEKIQIIRPKTRKKYLNILYKLKNPFVWSTVPVCAESLWLLSKITKWDYGFINNMDYIFPVPREERVRTKEFWTKWDVSRIKNAIFNKIPHNLIPVKKAKVVMAYSDESAEQAHYSSFWDKHTRFELANTIDYSVCMKIQRANPKPLIREPYIVFIDEYLPYHPDGKRAGFVLDAKPYYETLKSFFKDVESVTGKKVIIAAHPKADYIGEHSWCFEGFDIYQMKTAELIKDSELVFLEYNCLAKSMVVSYNKPAVFITTNEIEKTYLYGPGHNLARKSGVHIYNISDELKEEEIRNLIKEETKESLKTNSKLRKNYCLDESHPHRKMLFEEVMLKVTDGGRIKES